MTSPGEARSTDGADVVAQALPSLQHLRGKVLVIKLGGSTLERQRMILQDVLWLRTFSIAPVLVHGGGPALNAWLEKMHLPVTMPNGQRVSDGSNQRRDGPEGSGLSRGRTDGFRRADSG